MSSGNLVSVVYVPETAYGIPDTPLSGVTAETARFTSESISGTPTTTTSANIRTDRASGQSAAGSPAGASDRLRQMDGSPRPRRVVWAPPTQ